MRFLDIGFYTLALVMYLGAPDYRYALVAISGFIIGMLMRTKSGPCTVNYIYSRQAFAVFLSLFAVLCSTRNLRDAFISIAVLGVVNYISDAVVMMATNRAMGNIHINILATLLAGISMSAPISAYVYMLIGVLFGYFISATDEIIEFRKHLRKDNNM